MKPHKMSISTNIFVHHGTLDEIVKWKFAKKSYFKIDNTRRDYTLIYNVCLKHAIGKKGLNHLKYFVDEFIGKISHYDEEDYFHCEVPEEDRGWVYDDEDAESLEMLRLG